MFLYSAACVFTAATAYVFAVARFARVSFQPFSGDIGILEYMELAIVGDSDHGLPVAATVFLAVFRAKAIEVLPSPSAFLLGAFAQIVIPMLAFVVWHVAFEILAIGRVGCPVDGGYVKFGTHGF